LCRRLESTESELTFTTQCLNSARDELHKLKGTFQATLDAQIHAFKTTWFECNGPPSQSPLPIYTNEQSVTENDLQGTNVHAHERTNNVEEVAHRQQPVSHDNHSENSFELQNKLSAAETIINDLTALLQAREDDKEELECEHARILQNISVLSSKDLEACQKDLEARQKDLEACKKDLVSYELEKKELEGVHKQAVQIIVEENLAVKRELIKKGKAEKKQIQAKLLQTTNENIQLQLQLTREIALKETISAELDALAKTHKTLMQEKSEQSKHLDASKKRVKELEQILEEKQHADESAASADEHASSMPVHSAVVSASSPASVTQKQLNKIQKKLNAKQDKHDQQMQERESKHCIYEKFERKRC